MNTLGIKKFLSPTFIKFVLVGILNTAFGVGIYCLFIRLGFQYAIATLLSTILGVLWNFKTTGRLVFGSKDNSLIFRFVLCYCITYGFNVAVIYCFKLCGINDYWSGILATPIVALCSYGLLKNFVFNQKEKQSEKEK